jgi:hypothetical protein
MSGKQPPTDLLLDRQVAGILLLGAPGRASTDHHEQQANTYHHEQQASTYQRHSQCMPTSEPTMVQVGSAMTHGMVHLSNLTAAFKCCTRCTHMLLFTAWAQAVPSAVLDLPTTSGAAAASRLHTCRCCGQSACWQAGEQ